MNAEDLKDPRDRAAALRAEAASSKRASALSVTIGEMNDLHRKLGKAYTRYVNDWRERVRLEIKAADIPVVHEQTIPTMLTAIEAHSSLRLLCGSVVVHNAGERFGSKR